MRIVFLNPIGGLGGAELSLLDLLTSLRQQDESLDLHLIAGSDGPLLSRAEQLGVFGHRLTMPAQLAQLGDSALAVKGVQRLHAAISMGCRGVAAAPEAGRYIMRLRQLIHRLAPALIHSNGFKCHLLTRFVQPHKVPVIWHIHDFARSRPVAGRLLSWVAGRTDLIVAVSQAVATDASSLLPNVPVQLILNAIDLTRFSPGPGFGDELDQVGGLSPAPQGTVRIGLPATYARWKGQDVFLRAAAQASPCRDVAMRFYLIGGPIYRTTGSQFSEPELRELAKSLGLIGRVGLVPFEENMPAVYRALDIVVHASTQPEPFGRTIAEAMACARPVIVSAAGGAVELFTPEHDAIGVPPGDPAALAAAIARLATDPSLRQRLAEQARRTAVERFHRDRLGRQLMVIYRRILDSRTR